ncbi:MAG: hypothetical protein JWO87_485 [Phycisphaerales bacterium]|nr:hypothetical protein [Phycisphaerales bacterium]MDB5298822.1 hypothetical protein [Phycisphaerales bacterium]
MPPREYLHAVAGGLIMAFFWSAFVLVLTGQYRDILPEPARPEYSEMDTYWGDATATKLALSRPTLAKPIAALSPDTVAQAGVSGRPRIGPSLSIFGTSGRPSAGADDYFSRKPTKPQ